MTYFKKHSIGVFVGIICIVIGIRARGIFNASGHPFDYYIDTRVANINNLLVSFLLPIFAGLIAWHVGRLYRSRACLLDPARTRLSITAYAAAPAVTITILVFLFFQVWHIAAVPTSSRAWLAVILPYAVLLAVAIFWSGIAIRIPPALSVPLSVVGTWIAITYLPSLGRDSTRWLRHITGTVADCCQIYEALTYRTLFGSILMAIAVSLIGLAFVSHTWRIALPAALVVGAMLAIFAIRNVDSVGWYSVETRPENELNCETTSGGTEICLWREHETMRNDVTAAVLMLHQEANTHAVWLPSRLTEVVDEVFWRYFRQERFGPPYNRDTAPVWRTSLHRSFSENEDALRFRLIDTLIPQPVCYGYRPSTSPERSTERVAPLARALLYRVFEVEHMVPSDDTVALSADIYRALEASQLDVGGFMRDTVNSILTCSPVDIDDPFSHYLA